MRLQVAAYGAGILLWCAGVAQIDVRRFANVVDVSAPQRLLMLSFLA